MKLSHDLNEIELSCCAKEMLKEIWDKATNLLKSEDSIIKAPDFDGVLNIFRPAKLAKFRHTLLPPLQPASSSAIVNSINLSNSVNTPWQLQIFKANLSDLLTSERRTKHQQTSRI